MELPSEKDNPLRGISRIDQPVKRQHCWLVRMGYKFRKQGNAFRGVPSIQRSFPDKRYGGREASLLAAQAFRDAEEAKIEQKVVFLPAIHRNKDAQWGRRKEAINQGLRRVIVGTGLEGDWRARQLGICSSATLSHIRLGKQDSVMLQNLGIRNKAMDIYDDPFRNDITEEMYYTAKAHLSRYFPFLQEYHYDIIGDAFLYYARQDLTQKREGYWTSLLTSFARTMEKRIRHDSKTGISLDINGDPDIFTDEHDSFVKIRG